MRWRPLSLHQPLPCVLYVVDGKQNTIYTLTADFKKGTVFTEALSDSGVAAWVGTLDLKTGTVTAIAVGLGSPRGYCSHRVTTKTTTGEPSAIAAWPPAPSRLRQGASEAMRVTRPHCCDWPVERSSLWVMVIVPDH